MKLSKKEKIIQTALMLFNEYGYENIPINYISEYMGMSQGNIYYYFKNKNEITNEIFDIYSADLKIRFEKISEKTITSPVDVLNLFHTYMDTILFLQWEYRFFYLNMLAIMRKNEPIKQNYDELRHHLDHYLTLIIHSFENHNLIKIKNEDIPIFIENLKLHCSSWMNYQLAFQSNHTITKNSIFNEILKILFHFKCISTDNGLVLIEKIERQYLEKIIENEIK